MTQLENVTAGTRCTGLASSGVATVESAQWIGQQALKVIFRDGGGQLGERLLYRDDESSLELVEMGRPWSFDGDGELLRLVSEAYRINLAWLYAAAAGRISLSFITSLRSYSSSSRQPSPAGS